MLTFRLDAANSNPDFISHSHAGGRGYEKGTKPDSPSSRRSRSRFSLVVGLVRGFPQQQDAIFRQKGFVGNTRFGSLFFVPNARIINSLTQRILLLFMACEKTVFGGYQTKGTLQAIPGPLSNIVLVPPIIVRQAQGERRDNTHRIGRGRLSGHLCGKVLHGWGSKSASTESRNADQKQYPAFHISSLGS